MPMLMHCHTSHLKVFTVKKQSSIVVLPPKNRGQSSQCKTLLVIAVQLEHATSCDPMFSKQASETSLELKRVVVPAKPQKESLEEFYRAHKRMRT